MLKIPVFAPIPRASVSTALAANAGARRIWRSAYLTSCPTDQSIERRVSQASAPDPDKDDVLLSFEKAPTP
jgi:hypothetical protein